MAKARLYTIGTSTTLESNKRLMENLRPYVRGRRGRVLQPASVEER